MRGNPLASDLAPLDLEIEATCRRNNAERRRKILQDRTTQPSSEEAQSSESSSIFPEPREPGVEAMELIENMATSDHAILRDRTHIPTKRSLLELSSQDALLAQNKLLSKQLETLTETLRAHESERYIPLDDTTQENQGQWRSHPENQFNKDQGGSSNRPQNQGPSLYDRTTQLEETLAQFMSVTMSNHKSTESAIKNLEIQVGQLAKQIAENSSSNFGANTKKNPKEECKAIMTRSRKANLDEDEGRISDDQELVAREEEKEEEEEDQVNEAVGLLLVAKRMASRKRKTTASRPREPYDTTRFISKEYDEFRRELERRNWHKSLTRQMDGHIDVALVKEFYANLYDPEDKSPRQVRVRGKLIKFDVASLNAFLETPPVLEPGEQYTAYTKFCSTRIEPQEMAAKLYIPRKGFVFNAEGVPWKLLGKDLTTLAQTWSILSYSNLAPTSHMSNLNMDRARLVYGLVMRMDMDVGSLISGQISQMAQSNSSKLRFPALITALCVARGVVPDSLTFESMSSAINLAYIRNNCWNPDNPTITFLGTRKARAWGPSDASAPPALAPSSSAPPVPTPFIPSPPLLVSASGPSGTSIQSSDILVPML
ncbi:hypothetical protein HKD37_11G031763 [Glycine soja]